MDRDADRDRDRDRLHRDDPIFGAEVMTEQERMQFRERLRTMTDTQERARFMAEHRAEMRERARQQGVTLQEVDAAGDQDRDRDRMRDRDMDPDQDRDRDRLREDQ